MGYLNIHEVCEVSTHTCVALKELYTKAQHEKCSIQILFFTKQGSLLWEIFPHQAATEIWKNRLKAILTFCLPRWKLFPKQTHPLSNFLCFWLANSISSYLYKNVTKDECIYFPPCLSSTISSEAQHRVKHKRCTYLSMWMIKFMASKSTAFLAFECWTFLDFGGSYKSQAKFWFHQLFGLL